MTVTKIYCDHCKKELDTMHDYDDCEIETNEHLANVDLCCDCMDELNHYIYKFLNREVNNE